MVTECQPGQVGFRFPCGRVNKRDFTIQRHQTSNAGSLHAVPAEPKRHLLRPETRQDLTHDVSDINRKPPSRTRFKTRQTNKTDDIEKCRPRVLAPTMRNKIDNQLRVADINTNSNKGKLRTKRCTNPNAPAYKLASTQAVNPTPLRCPGQHQVRDECTRTVQGILGATPHYAPASWATRVCKFENDELMVEGCKPTQLHYPIDVGDAQRELIQSDIDQRKGLTKTESSSRRTNTMSPRYCYDVPDDLKALGKEAAAAYEYGEIPFNHKQPPKPDRPLPNRSLDTADIAGHPCLHESMACGSRPHPSILKFERFERTQLRNTNYNADIPGGTAATAKTAGLKTKRRVNPLTASKNGEYPYIGAALMDVDITERHAAGPRQRPASARPASKQPAMMMYSQGGSRPQSAGVRTPTSQPASQRHQAMPEGDDAKENIGVMTQPAAQAQSMTQPAAQAQSHVADDALPTASPTSRGSGLTYLNDSQQMPDPPSSSGSDSASRPGSATGPANQSTVCSRQRPQSAHASSQGRSPSGARPTSSTIRVSGANGGPVKKPSRPSSAVSRNYDNAFGREGSTGSSTAYYAGGNGQR